MIEAPRSGVVGILDEACYTVGNVSDEVGLLLHIVLHVTVVNLNHNQKYPQLDQ